MPAQPFETILVSSDGFSSIYSHDSFYGSLGNVNLGSLTAGSSIRTVIFRFKRSFRTVYLYGVDVERSAENPLSYFPFRIVPNLPQLETKTSVLHETL